ncbi:methionyl-tRNA formyltransferase [Methyloceanibacter caenitepidi]|uniref:Methionyl-tRNA formyltransferase n=1 Tax=Methyloceanibacter caenitepidi TaxID=1384459 RepID=A0A0A8JZJ1_9HYPH|nr:methionyl-tRNA formyltransferase [Methyloceanibacter caenitepidi]BAQ16233.1 methionyl-tRNA formyltransferase [Methyloceanibacter caenitepidi]
MRIIFMGTPDFAVPALLSVAKAGHDIVAVYTQPPRPAGRGMAVRNSPVHQEAEALGLPVRVPESLRSPAEQKRFAALEADAAVVVAYGLILPEVVLNGTRHGVFNIHASLLPRWRGAAPINRAIMAGDAESGVSIMRVTQGLDEGPVCLMDRVAIGPDMTAGELHDALSILGADLMVEVLATLGEGKLHCVKQDGGLATYAAKLTNEETRIDWARPAQEVHNHIRGLSPYPGAWFELVQKGKTERVKVQGSTLEKGRGAPGQLLDDRLTVACADGAVRLTRVQRAGKKPMLADAFLRGVDLPVGSTLL